MKTAGDLLRGNAYPGRGIVAGMSANGVYCAYFIMGRSENSRNRVFVEKDGAVSTQPFNASLAADPSLIIYNAVKPWSGGLIITNGDQTDTIEEFLKQGKPFELALETRDYEPDAPHFTPRVSALTDTNGYKISILRRGAGGETERAVRSYGFKIGEGRLIHTYVTDGDPLPSFAGEPKPVGIHDDFEAFTRDIWDNLDADNRVSLYTRSAGASRIINRHGGAET